MSADPLRRTRRPVAVIAGIVLGLGTLGGITGAALGGIGAAASSEHSGHVEHGPGRDWHGDDDQRDGLPPGVPAPAPQPGQPAAPAVPGR